MEPVEHRVNQLRFELRAAAQQDLDRFSAGLRGGFESVLVPALEAALDAADQPGEVIRLDRLEIDLGPLSGIDGDLGDRLLHALRRALPARPAQQGAANQITQTLDELLEFLATGTLAWPAPGGALKVMVATLMSAEDTAFAEAARRLSPVLRNSSALERLLLQLPAALVLRLLRQLLLVALGPLPEPLSAPRAQPSQDRPLDLQALPWVRRLLRRSVHGELSRENDFAATLSLLTVLEQYRGARLQAALRALQGLQTDQRSVSARDDNGPDTTGQRDQEFSVTELPGVFAAGEPAADSTTAAKTLHAQAAGAVLLHPFLGDFYGRLKLTTDSGEFISTEAQLRAVLLLHYLATGRDHDVAEPDAVVGKILCGLPLAHPLGQSLVLEPWERREAEQLLVSMIGHWGALGKTSPQGLREGFLMRSGRLQQADDGWLLTVEPRGADMLLDRLPWALSLVKTRFMRQTLRVEWR